MREDDQHLTVGQTSRVGLDRVPRIEKTPSEDAFPRAALRILHDQQAEHVDFGRPGRIAGRELQRTRERQRTALYVLQIRADQRVAHLGRARAQEPEEVVKLAIADRLRVVAGRIELGHHRLVAQIEALASAQRVAAIEEQARPLLAQAPQRRRDAAVIVQIRRVIDAYHDVRATSTA